MSMVRLHAQYFGGDVFMQADFLGATAANFIFTDGPIHPAVNLKKWTAATGFAGTWCGAWEILRFVLSESRFSLGSISRISLAS
jgi:hypothetical protein